MIEDDDGGMSKDYTYTQLHTNLGNSSFSSLHVYTTAYISGENASCVHEPRY